MLLHCGRRQQRIPSASCDSEIIREENSVQLEATAPSDISTDDVSDISTQTDCSVDDSLAGSHLGGSGDSDSEKDTTSLPSQMHHGFPSRAPPGLDPPQRCKHSCCELLSPISSPLDVPDVPHHSRFTSGGIAAPQKVARRWSRNLPLQEGMRVSAPKETHNCTHGRVKLPPGTAEVRNTNTSDSLAAIAEALDKLGPKELTTVKCLLDAREHSAAAETSGRMSVPLSHHAFTPFQGRSRACGKPSKAAKGNSSTSQVDSKAEPLNDNDSLSTMLSSLALIEDSRILTLRKLGRLGFSSTSALQTYLSQFGIVDRIMVCHSRHKVQSKAQAFRVRPGILGFAVMSNAKDAASALDVGTTHVVSGVEIEVFPFQRQQQF